MVRLFIGVKRSFKNLYLVVYRERLVFTMGVLIWLAAQVLVRFPVVVTP